jgi:hypothetical protein
MALAGLGAALLLVAVVVAAAARVRFRAHRRRAAPHSRTRIVGAWHEAVEHVAVLAHTLSPAMTAEEIATAPRRLPDDSLARLWALAGIFNQSQFAAAPATSAQANAAWRHAGEVIHAVRALLPWQQRLRLAVSRAGLVLADPGAGPPRSAGTRRRVRRPRSADARRS